MASFHTNLTKISPRTLDKIARDISLQNAADKPKAVSEYYRNYGCNWSDLVARYPELKNDKGLKD